MKFVCCCFFFCICSCVYGQESSFSQTYQELHKHIQTHIKQQQFEQGLRTNQKLYALAQKEKEPIAESLYWQNMALLHQNRDIAFYYHWKSIKILQKIGRYKDAQNDWLAYQNYNYKTPKHTIDSLEKAFKSFEKIGEKPFMAELGKALTAQALHEGKLNDALFYQKKTLELYQYTQNVQGITSTLLNGVLIYEKQGRKDKTIEIELELLKFIESIQSKEDLMICLHLVGYFYYRTQNRYALAIEYFLKTSQISQETDEALLKLQLFYIGLLYRNQEYHLKSSEYFEKVKDLTEKSPQTSLNQIPEVYNALGFSLSAKGNLAQARNYHIKATQIAEKTQDTLALAQAFDGVGQVHLQLKAYKEALEYLKKALAYSKSLHNHILTSYICYYMAEAYKGLDRHEESLAYALEAYQMALQANWGATKIKASLLLADLYQNNN
jgi:tetratricopeptide (TPR) repeat protein